MFSLFLSFFFFKIHKGEQLQTLARALKLLIQENQGRDVGVFLDFCSMYQPPPGGKRTDAENYVFKRALRLMDILYGHKHHIRLSIFPYGILDHIQS